MGFDLRGLALSSLDNSIDLFVRREERPMHLGIGRRLSDEVMPSEPLACR